MDLYFIGGGLDTWHNANHWSDSSGGMGGWGPPGPGDNAIFDDMSPSCNVDGDVTVDNIISTSGMPGYGNTLDFAGYNVGCGSIDWQGGFLAMGSGTVTVTGNCNFSTPNDVILTSGLLAVGGDFTNGAANFSNNGGTLRMNGAAGVQAFTSGGKSFNLIEQTGGSAVLQQDDLVDFLQLTLGPVGVGAMWDCNGKNIVYTPGGYSNGIKVRDKCTLQLGTGAHTLYSYLEGDGSAQISASGCTLTLGVNGGPGLFTLADTANISMPAGLMTVAGGFLLQNNSTLTHNNGTLKIAPVIGGGVTLNPRTSSLYNVIFDDSGAGATLVIPNAALTCNVANDFTLVNGTALLFTGDLAVGRDLLVQGGTMNCNGRPLAVGRDLVQSGGIATGGSGALSVARNLTLNAGTFTSTSGTLSVAGDFTKGAATFNHNNGTVVFTNSGLVSVLSTTGLATFRNLTFGASKTHRFTAGQTFRVNGALASNGTAATKSVMVSSVPGTYWKLTLAGTSALANKTNITDCDASSGVLVSAIGSTDGGHNLNIDFSGAPPTPATDFAVGSLVPSGDEDWFFQYDLDPATLRAWNTVGNWAFINNQPALVNAGCFSNGFGAPPGIGDTIEFRFVMTQGRYNFRLWCPQDADCGIVSIAMNGYVIEPALDLYAAPAEPSYVYLFKNRVLVPGGLQRLVFTVTGKNGGSSNFYARMYGFQYAPFLPQLVV